MMKQSAIDIDVAAAQTWDAVIIGTGIGGASVGFSLAKAGQKILFCDAGIINRTKHQAIYNQMPEEIELRERSDQLLLRTGRSTLSLTDRDTGDFSYKPFLGMGGGGSSALYGMAMERFYPSDFTQWPISYDELAPYYEIVEKQFRVKGERDPFLKESTTKLPDGPALSPANQFLFAEWKRQGLKPYQLPMACEFVQNCNECSGHLCPKACKLDAFEVYLTPAIDSYQAQYLELCTIKTLEADHHHVTGAWAEVGQKKVLLKAQKFILAAGALESPRILLASRSAFWPNGLANKSGLVGHFLMRHFIDLYAVRVPTKQNKNDLSKQLALSDFQFAPYSSLGVVQSFGRTIPAKALVADLIESAPKILKALVFLLRQPLIAFFSLYFKNRVLLATLSEDRPQYDNAVFINDQNHLEIRYKMYVDEVKRQASLRKEMRKTLSKLNYFLIKQAENNKRLAHVCGTCRFGRNENQSVLNAENRAHDILNLYVVDSSFFPTSGIKNPSLTIAANGLRVADLILNKSTAWKRGQ